MIFVITALTAAAAALAHATGWSFFGDPVTMPVAGLVAMCAMGVLARLIPDRRAELVAMVPPKLPRPDLIVWATGTFELAGGVGILFAPTRPIAAAGLALLLICVFPANVTDAHRKGDADGTFLRRVLLRGAQQVVFIALCVWTLIASVG